MRNTTDLVFLPTWFLIINYIYFLFLYCPFCKLSKCINLSTSYLTVLLILFDYPELFGMNMLNLSPHSSLHLSYRTLHSSLQHWILSLACDLLKIHTLTLLSDAPYILNLDCEYLRISLLYQYQTLYLFLFKCWLTIRLHFSRDQTITNHKVVLHLEFILVLEYLWSVECLSGQDLILHAYKLFSNR